MSFSWRGEVSLDDKSKLKSIILDPPEDHATCLPSEASLRLLSVVQVARIPLALVVSPPFRVSTTELDTQKWLQNVLLSNGHDEGEPWWQSARIDSSLGILIAIDTPRSAKPNATTPTEVLFYASRRPTRTLTPPDEAISEAQSSPFVVEAVFLCSDILPPSPENSPPGSPVSPSTTPSAVFLPQSYRETIEVINEPPTRKRKTANDAFDEAKERRTRARRSGVGTIAAAAGRTEPALIPSLKHHRSISGAISYAPSLQPRTLSRSPSITGSQPNTARAPSEVIKRSSLNNVQTAPPSVNSEVVDNIASKNKELVSRTVMACMRLHGLTQSKLRAGGSVALSPRAKERAEDIDELKRKDDEFKLIYHQVYRGICFAFRRTIDISSLQSNVESLREVADKLLDIYCDDPLLAPKISLMDELTPGGRKLFGSSTKTTDATNVFLVTPITSSRHNTTSAEGGALEPKAPV